MSTQPVTLPRTPSPFKASASDFDIRALNRDNFRDAEQLVELFRNSYDLNYPVEEVYDVNFWHSPDSDSENLTDRQFAIQNDITSIVVTHRGRFVAHIAIKHYRHGPVAQALFPAIHPTYRREVFTLSRLFWRCIETQARRQHWSALLHFSMLTYPMWQLLANKCFDSTEVAIIPSRGLRVKVTPGCSRRFEQKTAFVLMYNPLAVTQEPEKTLYIPLQHKHVVEELYSSLGITRTIKTDFQRAESCPLYASALPRITTNDTGIAQMFVVPSSDEAGERYLEKLANWQTEHQQRALVFIDSTTPECLSFADQLEAEGYRFCGVLPSFSSSDFILYSRFDDEELNELTLYSKRAKLLRDYLLNSTARSREDAH